MTLFLLLLTNLIPLYILIAVGFLAGRLLDIDRQSLANLAVYILVPVVIFGFIADLDLKPSYALLPFVLYAISTAVAFLFLRIGHAVYGDNRANLLAMCASMGNTGYFGLPLAMLLFDQDWLGVYMLMLVGFILFEATIGYYLAVRGRFTVRQSLIKLVKFPSLYVVAAGLAVNIANTPMPEIFSTYWTYFKGAYVVIGMMIIGVSLSRVERLVLSPRFLGLVFAGKFIAWPAIAFIFIEADKFFLKLFEPEVHRLIYVISIVPPAANIAAFAAQMDLRPEKAAAAILLGTVAALFYIPAMLMLAGIGK